MTIRAQYYPTKGYIGGPTWVVYESHTLDDLGLSEMARYRLAELCNEGLGWEESERVLIAEGLVEETT